LFRGPPAARWAAQGVSGPPWIDPGLRGTCPRHRDGQSNARSGFEPTDREFEKLGYDVESRVPGTGRLRFIEVKGRISGAETITVTKNEILYSLNKPDDFILALVEFIDDANHKVHYLRRPFERSGLTTDFNGASVNFPFAELIGRAELPR
jgi:hypothetical protein